MLKRVEETSKFVMDLEVFFVYNNYMCTLMVTKQSEKEPDEMIYKCPNCDAALTYNPSLHMMECDSCVSFYEPEQVSYQSDGVQEDFELKENNAEAFLEENIYAEDSNYIQLRMYRCTACGAELAVGDTEVSSFCAFCGQPTVIYDRVSKQRKPTYIIPFEYSREQAATVIRNRLRRRGVFVPKEIQNLEVLEKMRGIYVPYFLFHVKYKDNQEIQRRDKKRVQRFHLEAECDFRQLTCDAASRINDEVTQRIEPFNMNGLKRFEPGYLSGFYADSFDLTARQLTNVVKRRCEELFDDRARREISATTLVYTTKTFPQCNILHSEYALFPVWFMTFRYKGESYTMLVNGQTGKIAGGLPAEKTDLVIMFSAIAVFCAALLIAIGFFLESFAGLGVLVVVFATVPGFICWILGLIPFLKNRKALKRSKTIELKRYIEERQEADE